MTTPAAKSPNRWFFLACAALLVNTYGVWKLTHPANSTTPPPGKAGEPPVALLDFPAQTHLAGRAPVAWNFDRPMVAESGVGTWSTNRVLRVEPATSGEVRWESTRRLVFRPAADWRPCNRYHFIATKELADPAGRAPVNPLLGELDSDAFKLTGFRQVSYNPLESRATLRAVFNDRPADKQLPEILQLSPKGAGWFMSISNPRIVGGNEVEFEIEPYGRTDLSLALRVGALGASGPLGSVAADPLELTLDAKMLVGTPEAVLNGLDQPFIRLRLSNPPDAEKLAAFLSLEPAMPFTLETAAEYYSVNSVHIRADFIPGKTYKVRALKGLPGLNGSTLEKEVAQTVLIPDYPAQIGFADAGRYLSTRGRRSLKLEGVNVTNVTATVRQVYDNNLLYFAMRESDRYVRDYGSHVRGLMGPASALKLEPGLLTNKPGTFPLDLSTVVTNGLRGVFWVSVSADARTREPGEDYEYDDDDSRVVSRLVVVSDLGLSVKNTPSGLLAWVTSLHTGATVTGATVRVYSVSNQELGFATTGPDGVAHISLNPEADATAEAYVVTAATPDDLTFLAMETTLVDIPGEQGGAPFLRQGYEAFLYSDRGVYRPGETAHLRAIVRDPARGAPEPFPLELRVIRPDGRDAAKVTAMTSALGTVEFAHLFDPSGPIGGYSIQAYVPGNKEPIGTLSLQHEEFVPPQIVVKMDADSDRVSTGEVFSVRTTASHLFGSPAAGLVILRSMTIKAAPFAPAGWEDHVFGDAQRSAASRYTDPEEGELDENGVDDAERSVTVTSLPPAALLAVLVSTVIDGTGRPASAFGRKQVDPVPFYIGVKAGSGNWVAGQSRPVDIAAVHPSGVATNAGPLTARLEKVLWNTVLERGNNGGYTYVSKATRETVWTREVPLADGRARLDVASAIAGSYELCVTAPSGAATRVPLYVSSGTGGWQDVDVAKAGKVELSADVDAAAPGQMIRLTARAPFQGRALVTLESDRIITNAVVEMTGNAFEIPLRVPDTTDSTVYAVVSVVRALKAGDLPGTHRATGLLAIPVRRVAEKAALVIEAPELIRPQTDLAVTVRAPDLAGQPAEITIAAVDEGICMLTSFETPDILKWLDRPRSLAVRLYDAYNYLLPEVSDELFGRGAKVGGDGDMGLGSRLNPVDARRFRPVALWSGTLPVGPDGSVTAKLSVPEFTGKLRVMAVACGARRYGNAAQHVLVRRPLVVQPALPRFAAPGDRFEAGMRLHNLSGAPVNAKWTVTATGAASLAGDATGAADLAKDGQTSIRIPLAAAATSGVARVTFAAGEGELRYEETLELAVRPARSSVVESGALSVPAGESRTLDWPAGFAPASVRDRLCVAGLPSLSFSGGLEYLFRYPYGCLEQTTSTSFPLLYLVDLAELTDPRGRSRAENAARVQSGIARVLSMQLSDGWLALWPSSRDPYPYGSIYAAHFLTEAKKAGYEVPEAPFKDLLKAINSSLSSWNDGGATANGFNNQEIAYALYVLALNGQWNEGWSARLDEKADLAVSARILNAAARAVSGKREEAAKKLTAVSPAALAATTPRQLGGSLNSPVQDLSLLLSAWLEIDPANPALPDLARRLEATQKGGNGWYTTHDNALALMALGKFAARVAAEHKPFEADITVGAAKHAASTAKALSLKPDGALEKVVITNRGPGTAYVSWMRTGIPSAGVEPDNATGLKVTREWLDSTGQPRDPATFRQGDLAVVMVTVDSMGREVDQVAVEDLLPAGLEVENPVFKTSATVPWLSERTKGPLLHVEHRDDRVLAFSGAFNGQLVFGYQVRAVTPGDFVLPAVSAECMYDPSLRAAKGSGRIKVECLK